MDRALPEHSPQFPERKQVGKGIKDGQHSPHGAEAAQGEESEVPNQQRSLSSQGCLPVTSGPFPQLISFPAVLSHLPIPLSPSHLSFPALCGEDVII